MRKLMSLDARKNRRRRGLAAAVLALAMFGFAALLLGELAASYRQQYAAVRKEVENQSALIESNVLATIAKIDVVLGEAVHTFTPVLAGAQPRDAADANRELLRLLEHIPEIQENSLRVLDATGRVVFSAGDNADLPTVRVDDRAYFLRQKNEPDAGLVISEPLVSRVTGNWVITLSRRITGPDGRFLGLAQAALRTEYFQELFERLRVGPEDAISMNGEDFRLLARAPARPELLGQRIPRPEMAAAFAVGATAGSYTLVSPIDGIERLFIFRKLKDLPYVLNVGRSPEVFLAAWRNKAWLYGIAYLSLSLAVAAVLAVFVRHQRTIETLASYDPLTGLTNRRIFATTFDFAIKLRRRSQRALSVLLFDIDHFKRINDTLGHNAGDDVLRRVAAILETCLRESDLACRWGGEEFAVLLDGCDVVAAAEIADTIRTAIATGEILAPETRLTLTLSAGVAEVGDADTLETVIDRADQALYRAKDAGRNRVQRESGGNAG